jgi:hypothetical protein
MLVTTSHINVVKHWQGGEGKRFEGGENEFSKKISPQ